MSERSEELTKVLKQVQANPKLLRLAKRAPFEAMDILGVSKGTVDAILSANVLVGVDAGGAGGVSTLTFDTGTTITGNPGGKTTFTFTTGTTITGNPGGKTTLTFTTGTTITAGSFTQRPPLGTLVLDPRTRLVLERALEDPRIGRAMLDRLRGGKSNR